MSDLLHVQSRHLVEEARFERQVRQASVPVVFTHIDQDNNDLNNRQLTASTRSYGEFNGV